MHLRSLKVFCDVVGRRSFSRAAAENGMTQSGASQIVNHLEEHLKVKLIDRSKRPFVLTPEGEVYYEGCRKLVQRYFALEEEVRTLHEEVSGRVSVASIYSIGLSHINRLMQSFMRSYPKANVRVQYEHPHHVYELVENDQVDLGIVSFPKSSRAVKATAWREESMVLVCAPCHPLAALPAVRLEELHGLEMVAFDADLEIRNEIDRALASRGVEVRVAMEFDNTETIKRAVEIDAGVALVPEPTVDREVAAGTLISRPLSGLSLTRPIGIIQRRGKELGKTARRFMQLLLEQNPALRPPTDGTAEGTFSGAPGEPSPALTRPITQDASLAPSTDEGTDHDDQGTAERPWLSAAGPAVSAAGVSATRPRS